MNWIWISIFFTSFPVNFFNIALTFLIDSCAISLSIPVAITVPLLKQEIGVCLTVTVIAALATFDIVYVATAGGPGNATSVPGLQIYILAFAQRNIGLASALAVMLMILVVVIILPIQRLNRETKQ